MPPAPDLRDQDSLAALARESGKLWTAAVDLLSTKSIDVDSGRRMAAALAAQAAIAREAGLQISHNELMSVRRRLLAAVNLQATGRRSSP